MSRTRADDACPGALQVHRAADGALARVRLPGGMITAAQLAALAAAALRFGSPSMELTSRGNLQIRAVTDPTALADAIAAAGLLPSPSHERVRNVLASPLTGRVGGMADLRGAVRALDAAIQADAHLAELPGRFVFALDDGRGDVSGLGADVGAHLLSPTEAALLLGGVDTGVRMAVDDVVAVLTTVARRFVAVREKQWRIEELDDPNVVLDGFDRVAPAGATWPPVEVPPVGWLPQDDGAVTLGAGARLGVLDARTAEFLAAVEAPLVITPWRSVLVCDLDEGVADVALRVLAPRGLVFDAESPWLRVSSCTGSPGCDRSLTDVRRDAAEAAASGGGVGIGVDPVHRHFVGCDRACGSPAGGEVLIATGDGYRLRG